ncbi:MAG: ABC transporter substrate-binding protein [Brumimicrobium sp.]|nr:ABC transporter substrate-binding protein [Brumimicrobium sp.]MCO5269690.1 ABC transporter substrate-binding protein [Brumimicrobium sp.]
MTRKIILFTLTALLLLSCDTTGDKNIVKAKGGVRYGGTFRFMSSEKVTNLFPLETTNIYANRVASQIFEGLLKIDPASTDLVPSIAKEYSINDNATEFTFILRDDVFFQDDACFTNGKGRKVTASDFKYSLEFACSNNPMNQMSHLLIDKIKGAKEFYDGKSKNVEGIVVKDDYTLVIQLESAFSGFGKVLSHVGLSVFPKEAVDKYGDQIRIHPVGTGAFKLDKMDDTQIVLVKNNHYYKKDEFGNPLPFLDNIVMTYSQNKTDELLSFRAEKIDLVLDIPVEEVKNVLGSLTEAKDGKNVKHIVDSKTSMSLTYYGFANESKEFSDIRVRKAFNYAIDRQTIIESWLEGEGWPITNGFVPKIEGYPYENVKGFDFNIAKAKQLMSEAGYPDGRGFPTITLYVNALEGSAEDKLANAVKKSLKENLNVNIDIKLVSIDDREKAIAEGTAIFWRAGWIADYPSPSNFLSLFYSKNISEHNTTINPFKYKNETFDKYYEEALQEPNREERMKLFVKCDQIIIDDAVVMPILIKDYITMVNLRVRKFVTNEIETLDFSSIYIKEVE